MTDLTDYIGSTSCSGSRSNDFNLRFIDNSTTDFESVDCFRKGDSSVSFPPLSFIRLFNIVLYLYSILASKRGQSDVNDKFDFSDYCSS